MKTSLLFVLATAGSVIAHGGEDHGEQVPGEVAHEAVPHPSGVTMEAEAGYAQSRHPQPGSDGQEHADVDGMVTTPAHGYDVESGDDEEHAEVSGSPYDAEDLGSVDEPETHVQAPVGPQEELDSDHDEDPADDEANAVAVTQAGEGVDDIAAFEVLGAGPDPEFGDADDALVHGDLELDGDDDVVPAVPCQGLLAPPVQRRSQPGHGR